MLRSFAEVADVLRADTTKRTLALAGADDDIALEAVARARREGVADAILVGDEEKVTAKLEALGEDPSAWRIVNASTEMQSARYAVRLVVNGEADLPMKGLVQTATFLMAVQYGGLLDADGFVNEFTVMDFADQERLIVYGDCAVNIKPTVEERVKISQNLIDVARVLGASPVRVAALSAVEKPDPTISSSVEARELAEMDCWGNDVIYEGPLALDNVLDAEAAAHKGIKSEVAGKADVIVVPEMIVGNVLHKSAHFFGHYAFASGLLGAKAPVVMNSRTDDVDAKYCSILMGCLLASARANASESEAN